jgi:hypothetical protein
MLDMDSDLVLIGGLFTSRAEVAGSMIEILDFCSSKYPLTSLSQAYKFPYRKETEDLQEWALHVLTREPPPDSIKAYYFGLFERVGKENDKRVVQPRMYISGSEHFDAENSDWACSPTYFPTGRYVVSEVLTGLERIAKDSEKHYIELSYLLQISFAGLAVSHIMHALSADFTLGGRSRRELAVGFDSGDLHLLPCIER